MKVPGLKRFFFLGIAFVDPFCDLAVRIQAVWPCRQYHVVWQKQGAALRPGGLESNL